MPSKTKRVLLSGVEGVVKSKFVGCNTLELEYQDGTKAIRYHNTDVITTKPNGDRVLDSGGWRTYTTKERLNRQFRVWSDKGIWYVSEPATGKALSYFDGITFDAKGNVKGVVQEVNLKEVRKVKRKIAKYIKLVDELESIPFPEAGDCWYCALKNKNGQTMGDVSNDSSHLESHLTENYLMHPP